MSKTTANSSRAYRLSAFAVAFIVVVVKPSFAAECTGKADAKGVRQVKTALVFSTPHLNVDADGAPNAYRADGNGLSYTCDGVVALEDGKRVTPTSDPANWQTKCKAAWKQARETGDYSGVAIFGFATDASNRPLVQQAGDPFPGEAFITTTSVKVPEGPAGTQRREIDATRIPYIVLPGAVVKKYGVPPAGIAIVYRPSTDRAAFAVYGDAGNLGEASVKLHVDLGNDPLVVKSGTKRAKRRIEDRVVTFVFPALRTDPALDHDAWNAQIRRVGEEALNSFGGMEQVRLCAQK